MAELKHIVDPGTVESDSVLKKNAQGIISWGTGGGGEPDTYIKDASVNNEVLTMTKKDDTEVTLNVSGKQNKIAVKGMLIGVGSGGIIKAHWDNSFAKSKLIDANHNELLADGTKKVATFSAWTNAEFTDPETEETFNNLRYVDGTGWVCDGSKHYEPLPMLGSQAWNPNATGLSWPLGVDFPLTPTRTATYTTSTLATTSDLAGKQSTITASGILKGDGSGGVSGISTTVDDAGKILVVDEEGDPSLSKNILLSWPTGDESSRFIGIGSDGSYSTGFHEDAENRGSLTIKGGYSYPDISIRGGASWDDWSSISMGNEDVLSRDHNNGAYAGKIIDWLAAKLSDNTADFSSSATYAVGSFAKYNGDLYVCKVAVVAAGAWTGNTNWTAMPNVSSLFGSGNTTLGGTIDGKVNYTIGASGNLADHTVRTLGTLAAATTLTIAAPRAAGALRDFAVTFTEPATAVGVTFSTTDADGNSLTFMGEFLTPAASKTYIYYLTEIAANTFLVKGEELATVTPPTIA